MTQNKNPTTQSLDKLLAIFAGNRIVSWSLIAIVVHVVIIGGTSLTYVRDQWIDPEGAAQRKAAVVAEQKRLEKEEAAAAAPALAGLTNAAAVVSDVNAPGKAEKASETSVIPVDRANTPTAQRITEVAKPEELPKVGGDLGISIEDTGLR